MQKNLNTRKIRLLIVDDEKGFVDVLAKRLEKRDVQVTCSYNGAEGIRALRRSEFDAAVLDLKMEGIDGIELLKIFKKMDPALPVIMLTGHGCEKASEEGMACGAYQYLTKPCSLEDLVAIIEKAMRYRRGCHDKCETPSR